MTRVELLAQLEDEIAQGYPPPLDGSHLPFDRLDRLDRVLIEYIGIVADVAVAAETAGYTHTLRAVS